MVLRRYFVNNAALTPLEPRFYMHCMARKVDSHLLISLALIFIPKVNFRNTDRRQLAD